MQDNTAKNGREKPAGSDMRGTACVLKGRCSFLSGLNDLNVINAKLSVMSISRLGEKAI